MIDDNQTPLVIILGCTASGKTELSITVSQALNGAVVSADSMQIYRSMDIGTGKPSSEQLAAVQHYMLDVVNPDETFNAARYKEMADDSIQRIIAEKGLPVVVGGSGLYIKILLRGIFPAPPVEPQLREKLRRESEVYGRNYLYERLLLIDPKAAKKIEPSDQMRIIRALEIYEQTGIPMSEHQFAHSFKGQDYLSFKVGIRFEREELYRRIEKRVDQMVEMGLVQEVAGLLERGYSTRLSPMNALGYRQIAEHLLQGLPLEEAVRKIKRETKRYAKRQATWFKGDDQIRWYDAPLDEQMIIEDIRAFLKGE